MLVAETTPDAVLWLLAADHAIADTAALHAALAIAADAARAGRIVTFGMRPTAPETGYGYIAIGRPAARRRRRLRRRQLRREARRRDAARLATDGRHLWNSGMFVFTARTLLEELETHAPDVPRAVRRAMADRHEDLDFIRLGEKAFAACPSISLDYAVAERTQSRRGGARRYRLVRRRKLGRAVGTRRQGPGRQRRRRRRAAGSRDATATSAATACSPPWSAWRTRWSW